VDKAQAIPAERCKMTETGSPPCARTGKSVAVIKSTSIPPRRCRRHVASLARLSVWVSLVPAVCVQVDHDRKLPKSSQRSEALSILFMTLLLLLQPDSLRCLAKMLQWKLGICLVRFDWTWLA